VIGRGHDLAALIGFLDLLAQGPEPKDVAAALARGPLVAYQPATSFIAVRDCEFLHGIGAFGFTSHFHARYQAFPLSYDWPASRAVVRNEIIDVSIATMFAEYPTLAVDRALWEPVFADRNGDDGRLVAVPIVYRGVVTGVFGFVAFAPDGPALSDATFLLGTAGALALWLESSNLAETRLVREDPLTRELPLFLHERQRKILRLVGDGKSNRAIAHHLGYSISTVKLDLNRAMRMLRVSDRFQAAEQARELGFLDGHAPTST